MCSGYNPIRNVDVKKILGYTGRIRIYIFLPNYVVWQLQVQTSFQGLGLQPTWLQVLWDREFAPYQDCSVNTLEDYTNQMPAITLSTSSAGTDLALKGMNTIGTVKIWSFWKWHSLTLPHFTSSQWVTWDKLLFVLSRDVPWISHSWLPVTVLTLHVHCLLELGEGIGRYRVLKTLTFKTRPSAKLFLWKWVLYAWEWQIIFISIA